MRFTSARQALRCAGASDAEATAAAIAVTNRIGDVDPDSQTTMIAIAAMQNAMKKRGMPIVRTGRMDGQTVRALEQVVGPRWQDVSFLRVFQNLRGQFATLSGEQFNTKGETLGATSQMDTTLSWLNGSLLPRPSVFTPIVPLEQIRTQPQAQAYALSGFHASVKKGLASRNLEAKILYAEAAKAYAIAYGYSFVTPGKPLVVNNLTFITAFPLSEVLSQIKSANALSDRARASVPASVVAPAANASNPDVPSSSHAGGFPVVPALLGAGIVYFVFGSKKKRSSRSRRRR